MIARTFGAWRVEDMERAEVPSDTRMLEVIVARLSAAPDPRYRSGGRPVPGRHDVTLYRSQPAQIHIVPARRRPPARARPGRGPLLGTHVPPGT